MVAGTVLYSDYISTLLRYTLLRANMTGNSRVKLERMSRAKAGRKLRAKVATLALEPKYPIVTMRITLADVKQGDRKSRGACKRSENRATQPPEPMRAVVAASPRPVEVAPIHHSII